MSTNTERKVRTMKERAQDDLDKADRKVKALEARLAKAKAELATVESQIEGARAERNFLASHPSLREGDQGVLPVEEADDNA